MHSDYWVVNGLDDDRQNAVDDELYDEGTPLMHEHKCMETNDAGKTSCFEHGCLVYVICLAVTFVCILMCLQCQCDGNIQPNCNSVHLSGTPQDRSMASVDVHICKHAPVKSIMIQQQKDKDVQLIQVRVRCGWLQNADWKNTQDVAHCSGFRAIQSVTLSKNDTVASVACVNWSLLHLLHLKKNPFNFIGFAIISFDDGNQTIQIVNKASQHRAR
jgi:hypothetical protein